MQIIETNNEFEKFVATVKATDDDIYCSVVYSDNEKHSAINNISLVFVHLLNENKSFCICFKHNDTLSLDNEHLIKLEDLLRNKTVYVLDKKKFIQNIDLPDSFDIGIMFFLETNKNIKKQLRRRRSKNDIERFYSTFRKINNIHKCVPITKHIQKEQQDLSVVKKLINKLSDLTTDECFQYINDLMVKAFGKIEKNGLHIDKEKLDEYFPDYDNKHVSKELIFSEYNFFTTTGRPSNRYANINFNALNKSDGTREVFNSRFDDGYLLNIDYDAYHLRLVAKLINYKFPESESVHRYLGKQYFGVDELTDEQYEDSKSMSFFKMYGHNENEKIPFFKQLIEFKKDLWIKFKKNGFVKTPVFGRKIQRSVFNEEDNINADKIFNYLIQSYETERNAIVINEILNLLENYNTKLVLYTYDSFLFDFDPTDGQKLVQELIDIIGANQFFIKTERGEDYHNLQRIKK